MAIPKNHPDILALTNDAQALIAGHWVFGKGFTLTLSNQHSLLSTRAKSAMVELVSSGLISDKKADDGYAESRAYSLTAKGADMEFRKSFAWMEKNGKFPVTEAIK